MYLQNYVILIFHRENPQIKQINNFRILKIKIIYKKYFHNITNHNNLQKIIFVKLFILDLRAGITELPHFANLLILLNYVFTKLYHSDIPARKSTNKIK